MKKLFCVLLSLTMIFALCACGGGDEKAPEAPADATETPVADTAEEPPATDAEKPADDAEAPAEEEKEELKPFSIGVVDGSTYESQYMGIGCTIPEGWKLLAADELQELGDMVDEVLSETDYSSIPTIQDMYAIDAATGNNVNIVLTQMGDIERVAMKSMSEEEILEGTLASKDNLIATYEQAGMSVKGVEADVLEFLGEEHHVMRTEYSMNGTDAIIIQLFDFNIGGEYGATITFTASTMEEIAEMATMFFALD